MGQETATLMSAKDSEEWMEGHKQRGSQKGTAQWEAARFGLSRGPALHAGKALRNAG